MATAWSYCCFHTYLLKTAQSLFSICSRLGVSFAKAEWKNKKKKAQQILCPCYKTSPNWKTLSQSSKQRYHLDFEWTSKNEIDFKAVFQIQEYCMGWSFSNSCIQVLIFSYADISDKIFIPPIPALCNSKSRISTRLNSPYFGINLVYSIFENVTLP